MDWNDGTDNQWEGRYWCRTLHSDEGEIWSCDLYRTTRILQVRKTNWFTVFTINFMLLWSERGVDDLQNVLFSINFFTATSIKLMFAKHSTFPFAYLCSLIQTKSLRYTTWSRTALHINLCYICYTWVAWTSLQKA